MALWGEEFLVRKGNSLYLFFDISVKKQIPGIYRSLKSNCNVHKHLFCYNLTVYSEIILW